MLLQPFHVPGVRVWNDGTARWAVPPFQRLSRHPANEEFSKISHRQPLKSRVIAGFQQLVRQSH
jgi:hypothetical protein